MVEVAFDLIIVISIVCAALGVFLYEQANHPEKVFFLFVFAKALFEILAIVLAELIHNNLVGLHVYTLVQFIVLSMFFGTCFNRFKVGFRTKWIIGIGTVAILLNSVFLQPVDTYNSNSKVLVELYIIIVCIGLFVLLIRKRRDVKVNMQASASFVSAVFLESSISFIYYLYSNELVEMDVFYSSIIIYIKLALNFLVLFIILFGLYQIHTREKSKIIASRPL